MHQCGGKYLYFINPETNIEYVVCDNCHEAYLTTYIKMYCFKCSEVYYSCLLNNNYDPNLQLVTWKKYHCNAVIKDCIKCQTCKGNLLLNIKENKLICDKCRSETNPEDIVYNCLVCKKDFNSNLKIYNPIEFDIIKISIKNALLYKSPSSPYELPCCKEKIKNIKIFYHKKECRGALYAGKWINNPIVVCSKCKMFSESDKFIWTCTICFQRFKTKSPNGQINLNKIPLPALSSYINDNDEKINKAQINLNVNNINNITNLIINNNINISNVNIINKSPCYSRNASSQMTPEVISILSNKTNEFDFENIKSDASKIINNITNIEKCPEIPHFNRKFTIDKNKFTQTPNCSSNRTPHPHLSPISKNALTPNDQSSFEISPIKRVSKLLRNIHLNNSHVKDLSSNKINFNPNFDDGVATEILNSAKDVKNANQIYNIKTDTSSFELNSDSKVDENLKSFDYENYKVIVQIGEGSFGKIYLVEDEYNRQFSMKKIIANDEKDVDNFLQEYELVNKLRHNNILRIHSICRRELDSTTHALFVLMEKGITDWEKEIKARHNHKKYYSEKELFNILRQLTEALAFLQLKNISHRDIKPQNVLLFKEGIFKIADFGEAKKIEFYETNKQLSTLRGTELYMSPLLFNGLRTGRKDIKHNSFKSDVFSLGFCLLYAATLSIHCIYELRRETDNYNIVFKLTRFLKTKYSENLVKVLIKMLEIDENKRCDFIELQSLLLEIKS